MPDLPLAPGAVDLIPLAPSAVLTVWGLVVLAIDFGGLRRVGSDRRGKILGLVALVGVLLALVACALPEYPGVGPRQAREPSLLLGRRWAGRWSSGPTP